MASAYTVLIPLYFQQSTFKTLKQNKNKLKNKKTKKPCLSESKVWMLRETVEANLKSMDSGIRKAQILILALLCISSVT